jgi:molybdopterin biosynthesis enzyme MoaB
MSENTELRVMTVSAHVDGTPPPAYGAADDLLARAGFPVRRHQPLKLIPRYIAELIEMESIQHEAIVVTFSASVGSAGADVGAAFAQLFAQRGQRAFPGFGEALRRMAAERLGADAMFLVVECGVVNNCLVFAFPDIPAVVADAVEKLIAPSLERAVALHGCGR